MRLIENLPERGNFKVYFDNFFTSISLLIQLKEKGFHVLGVLKTNRMSGAILKSKADVKRQGRGAVDSCVSKSGDITIVRWQDNNGLTLPLLLLKWVTSIRLNEGAKSIRPR